MEELKKDVAVTMVGILNKKEIVSNVHRREWTSQMGF